MEVLVLENSPDSEKDRVLRQKALSVKNINDEIRETVKTMLEIMHTGKGIGLAGPQVGFLRRIFVTHTEQEGPLVFINPSITWTSHEQSDYEEGCLSLPGVYADVRRPEKIRVQAWDEKGRAFNMEVSGILARVIQHENDHLEGILFIDRINELKRQKLLVKLKKHNVKTKKQKRAL
jgi:peptide deformylase